ncbi:MAG: hypothetical protein FJ308_23590, partial [Planctomycetes bacterium]|nr:hypothetical protein [Planctomycetota bacterium]
MSGPSYLLLTSSTRDRLLYPDVGNFVVPCGTINNVNRSDLNVFHSTNPISYGLPDYNFCWTNYNPPAMDEAETFRTQIVAGNASEPILVENVNTDLLGIAVTRQNLSLQQTSANGYGILKGWLLIIVPDPTQPDVTETREILDYDPTLRAVTLRNPFFDFDVSRGPLEAVIRNYSLNQPLIQVGPLVVINGFFLEKSSVVYFDFPVYLYDVSLNQVRLVKKYDNEVFAFELCTPFSPAWQVTDQYWVISRSSPMALGDILPITTPPAGEAPVFYNLHFLEDYVLVDKGRHY